MIPHTKAFAVLKREAQQVFDFAIVVTYAVPALKYALKGLAPDHSTPFKPDHFDSRPIAIDKVKENAKEYKALLSRYIFLSSFSFFEAYFRDVLTEIIDFHGRDLVLERVSIKHNAKLTDADSKKQKRKLQEYPTPGNRDRYLVHGRRLYEKGFRFPSALLSGYGLRRLLEIIPGESVRATDIPKLAQELLQVELDESTEIAVFNGYRQTRNKIAHGQAKAASLHLRKAIEANHFLRNLALKIDRHVVDNFFVIEVF
jgi:hypothetical protein